MKLNIYVYAIPLLVNVKTDADMKYFIYKTELFWIILETAGLIA